MANALLSTVNAARQRQPMCNECERSLPNQIVFDKIESIIKQMQDEQNGLPVKTAKSFMSKIPSVFTGTDLIQWMMRNLKLEDQQEAVHLANLIASHGYIFPIEDHTLSIKNDCTFYRFQTPCLWPSNNSDPENTDYAVYLCKRTMQGKTRLELADYEAENLARLQKMFSRKWEFIFMQAESQAKVDKKRDKLERKVLDSQERAFWDVYRPVPGCVNTTELDIKKACRLSKSAKRCGECQKVAAAQSGPAPVTVPTGPSPEVSFSQDTKLAQDSSTSAPTIVAEHSLTPAKPLSARSSNENVATNDGSSPESRASATSAQTGAPAAAAQQNPSDISKINDNNSNSNIISSGAGKGAADQASPEAACTGGGAGRQLEAGSSLKVSKSGSSSACKKQQQISEQGGKSAAGIGGHQHHQHHHHHHHHHPHQHGHHHHHHHHHHRQCPHHHKHHQHTSEAKSAAQSGGGGGSGQQLTLPAESVLTATMAASAGLVPAALSASESQQQQQQPVKRVQLVCTKKRSVGSVDSQPLLMRASSQTGATGCRRKSECNRIPSMAENEPPATDEGLANKPARLSDATSGSNNKIAAGQQGDNEEAGSLSQRHDDSAHNDNGCGSRSRLEARPASACSSFTAMVTDNGDGKVEGSEQHRAANQRSTSNQSSQQQQRQQSGATSATKHHHQQQQQFLRKGSLSILRTSPANERLMGSDGVGQTTSAAATTRKSSIHQMHVAASAIGGNGSSIATSSGSQHSPLKGTKSVCGPSSGASGIGAATTSSELLMPRLDRATAGSHQNIGDLERELESLRVRLDRRIGGVKMSKVTQSYLSYFKQWAEYDPFIAQPIPSNPWISDSTELWDSERQTKDVHCRRVRRWAFSLKELLNDPAGREQFHRFLEKEFSAENLKFWDAVQELKRVHSRDVARRVEAIWTEYLAQDANCPINIDSKSYETSKKNMAKNKNNRCIFDEAAGHVYQLMKNDSYPRYLRSDMYKDYKEASEKKRSNQVAFDVFKPQITTLKHKFNF